MIKKKTHSEFLEELHLKNEHYINGEFEVVGEYNGNNKHILTQNKHGFLLSTPSHLLENVNPSILAAKNKTEYFKSLLKECNEGYKNRLFTIKGDYKNNKSVFLVLWKYGVSKMKAVSLLEGASPSIKNAINQNRAVKRNFNFVHGDTYDYSKINYTRAKDPLIIGCTIHGDFPQSYDVHRRGVGCPKCGIEKIIIDQEEIKRRLKTIEPNSNFDLTNVRVQGDYMGVTCQYGHEYNQRVKDKIHNKNGCPVCSSIMQSFTYELSGNQLKDAHKIPRILYVFHFSMGQESFFKVGATRNINKRIKDIRRDAKYNIKVVSELHTDAMTANTMEDYFLTSYKHLQYIPLKYFGGYTECFSIDVVRWEWNERGHWDEYKLEQDRLWCEEHGLDFEQNFCHYYLS